MAGAIPRSTLIIRPQDQRGFAKQHALELQDDVLDFLLHRPPVSAQPDATDVP